MPTRAVLRIVAVLAILLVGLGQRHAVRAQYQSKLTISPTGGTPGSVVTLTAPAGSLPGNSIAEVDFVDATGIYVGLPIARIQINPDGSFTFNAMVVPEAAAGDASIYVTSAGISISNTFQVRPEISVSPAAQQQKMPIQVIGSGFAANAVIMLSTIGADGTVQPATPVGNALLAADVLGTFTAMIVVPRGTPAGPLQIAASDSVYTATTTLQAIDPQALTSPAVPPTATMPGTIPSSGGATAPSATPTATSAPTGPAPGGSGGTLAYFAEGYTGQGASNGKATFRETLNILNPSAAPATAAITYYVEGSATPVQVTRTVAPGSVLRESVNGDVGSDKNVAAAVASGQRLYVTRTIERMATNGGQLDGSTTEAVRTLAQAWGFPEGYTGYSFQEYLTLLNPQPQPANVLITLAPQGGSAAGTRTLTLRVPAQSRVTANIRALNSASSTKSVAMLVSSDQPIAAERVEYFGDGAGSGKAGSTVSAGVTQPATTLRFAYGTAAPGPNGDQHFITVLNPATSGAPVSVTARYFDAGGRSIGRSSFLVAPGTRQTLTSSAVAVKGAVPTNPFSVTLQATGPIDAEAAQYYGGSPNSGAHPGMVFPGLQPGSDLFLSDLSTALADGTPIDRALYLYNPGGAAVAVSATFFGASGTPAQASYTVPAGGIATVPVNQAVAGRLAAGALSAELRVSGGNIIAYGVGRTAGGLAAFEDVGVAP